MPDFFTTTINIQKPNVPDDQAIAAAVANAPSSGVQEQRTDPIEKTWGNLYWNDPQVAMPATEPTIVPKETQSNNVKISNDYVIANGQVAKYDIISDESRLVFGDEAAAVLGANGVVGKPAKTYDISMSGYAAAKGWGMSGGMGVVDFFMKEKPNVIWTQLEKAALNRSLLGKTVAAVSPQAKADLMKDLKEEDLTGVEDVIASVYAMTTLDAPFLVATSSVGSFFGNLLSSSIRNRAVASMVTSGVLEEVAKRVVSSGIAKSIPLAIAKALPSITSGAISLGSYEAANQILDNKIQNDKWDVSAETIAAFSKGATLGAVTSAIGLGTKPLEKWLGKYISASMPAAEVATAGGEVFAFGALSPILDGRAPTTEDFGHALATIAGLKVAGLPRKLYRNAEGDYRNDVVLSEKDGEIINRVTKSDANKLKIEDIGKVINDKTVPLDVKNRVLLKYANVVPEEFPLPDRVETVGDEMHTYKGGVLLSIQPSGKEHIVAGEIRERSLENKFNELTEEGKASVEARLRPVKTRGVKYNPKAWAEAKAKGYGNRTPEQQEKVDIFYDAVEKVHAIDEYRRKSEPIEKPAEVAEQPIEPVEQPTKPEYIDKDTQRVSDAAKERIKAEQDMIDNPTQENIDKVIAIYESSAKESSMKLVYQSAIDKLKNGEITTASKEHEKIKEYAEKNNGGDALSEDQATRGETKKSSEDYTDIEAKKNAKEKYLLDKLNEKFPDSKIDSVSSLREFFNKRIKHLEDGLENSKNNPNTTNNAIDAIQESLTHHRRNLEYLDRLESEYDKSIELIDRNNKQEKAINYAERNKSGEVLPEAQRAEGEVGGSGNMPEVNKTESKDRETIEVEPEWGDANKVFTKEAYEKSLENLRNKLSANPFLDPEYWNNMVNVAGYHIEAGARKFSDFAIKMTEALGDNIKPYLKDLYEELRKKGYSSLDDTSVVDKFDINKDLKVDNVSRALNKLSSEAPKGYKNYTRQVLKKYGKVVSDSFTKKMSEKTADIKKQERDIKKQMALDYRKKVAEVRAKDKDNFTKRVVQLKEQYKKDVSDRVLKETDSRKKLVAAQRDLFKAIKTLNKDHSKDYPNSRRRMAQLVAGISKVRTAADVEKLFDTMSEIWMQDAMRESAKKISKSISAKLTKSTPVVIKDAVKNFLDLDVEGVDNTERFMEIARDINNKLTKIHEIEGDKSKETVVNARELELETRVLEQDVADYKRKMAVETAISNVDKQLRRKYRKPTGLAEDYIKTHQELLNYGQPNAGETAKDFLSRVLPEMSKQMTAMFSDADFAKYSSPRFGKIDQILRLADDTKSTTIDELVNNLGDYKFKDSLIKYIEKFGMSGSDKITDLIDVIVSNERQAEPKEEKDNSKTAEVLRQWVRAELDQLDGSIKDIDLERLGVTSLKELFDIAANIKENGDYSFSGKYYDLGEMHKSIENYNTALDGREHKIYSFTSWKSETAAFFQQFSVMAERAWGSLGSHIATLTQHITGIGELENATSRSRKEYSAIRTEYDKLVDKKNVNANMFKESSYRALYKWLIQDYGVNDNMQYVMDNIVKPSYDRLVEYTTNYTGYNEVMNEYRDRYKDLIDFMNKHGDKTITELEKMKGLKDIAEFEIAEQSKHFDKLNELSLKYKGKPLVKRGNYSHMATRLIPSKVQGDIEAVDFQKSLTGVGGTMQDRYGLGRDRFYIPDARASFLEGVYQNVYDVNTLEARNRLNTFLKSESSRKLVFGGNAFNEKYFLGFVKNYLTENNKAPIDRTLDKFTGFFNQVAMVTQLGSVRQVVAQTVPATVRLMLSRPDLIPEIMKSGATAITGDNMALINKYAIGEAGRKFLEGQYVSHTSSARNEVYRAMEGYGKVVREGTYTTQRMFNFAREKFLYPLAMADMAAKRLAWLTYYQESLDKQGIDYNTNRLPDNKIAAETANRLTANIASSMTAGGQAKIFKSRGVTGAAVYTLLPFASFSSNAKNELVRNIQQIYRGVGMEKLKAVSGTTGIMAETVAFEALKAYLFSPIYMAAGISLYKMMGSYFGFDDDENMAEYVDIKQMNKEDNFLFNTVYRITVDGTGAVIENAAGEFFNDMNKKYKLSVDDKGEARTIYVQDVNLSSGKLGTSINAISDLGKFGAMMLTGETKNAKGEKVKLTDTEKKMVDAISSYSLLLTTGVVPADLDRSLSLIKKEVDTYMKYRTGQEVTITTKPKTAKEAERARQRRIENYIKKND